MSIDHVDDYRGIFYITYLRSIKIDGDTNIGHKTFRLPGDVSDISKKIGLNLFWQNAIVSEIGIKTFLLIAVMTTILTWWLWPRIKRLQQ